MAGNGRRKRDEGLVADLYAIFKRHPIAGPAVTTVAVFGGMRWALPALLRLFAGSPPSSTHAASDVGQALSHGAFAGIADALSLWAPWATVTVVGLPTLLAWAAVAWQRTSFGKIDRLRSARPIRTALLSGSVPTPGQVQALTWMEFETLLADAFRLDGYAVDHCRRRGPDGGVDLRLRREGETTLVQCKHWKAHQVGVAAARELLGLVVQQRASGGILVTSGSFSDEARRFAATTAVQLVDASLLGSLLRRTTSQPQGQNVQVQSASTPSCPFCGAVTVQRRSRYGRFYGCSRYPRCRGIVDDSRVAAS